MDWLSTKRLNKIGQKEDARKVKTLPASSKNIFDYENFIPSMFQHLEKTLKENSSSAKLTVQGKNNMKAGKFCEKGRNAFKCRHDKKGLQIAVELQTKCVAHANPGSLEIMHGHVARSFLLSLLQMDQESMEEIDKIMKNGNLSEDLLVAAHIVRASCFAGFAKMQLIQSKKWLNQVALNDDHLADMQRTLKKYSSSDKFIPDEESEFHQIENPNERFPCASDAIDVQHCETIGRQVVANRDIEIGEILVVEQAYCRALRIENAYTHCWNCLKNIWNGIPCDSCANIIYCSENCKTSAWDNYHKFECAVLDMTLQYEINDLKSLGMPIRLLLQATVDAGDIQSLKERLNNLPNFSSKQIL